MLSVLLDVGLSVLLSVLLVRSHLDRGRVWGLLWEGASRRARDRVVALREGCTAAGWGVGQQYNGLRLACVYGCLGGWDKVSCGLWQ